MTGAGVEKHVSLFGGLRRSGRWTMAEETSVLTLFGGTDLDLTEALIPAGATLTHVALCGGVRVRAPADVHIALRSVSLIGGPGVGIADDEGTRVVRVRAYTMIGGVRVVRA